MKRTLILPLLILVAALVAACGQDPAARPAVLIAPGQAPPTTAPATTTTDGLGDQTTTTAPTTTATEPTTTTTVVADATPKEQPLPDGAQHGDQPEVVQHFDGIDSMTDCDALAAEQAADQAEQAQMLATRSVGDHRAHAELDDRYAEQAHHQMNAHGCNLIAHTE